MGSGRGRNRRVLSTGVAGHALGERFRRKSDEDKEWVLEGEYRGGVTVESVHAHEMDIHIVFCGKKKGEVIGIIKTPPDFKSAREVFVERADGSGLYEILSADPEEFAHALGSALARREEVRGGAGPFLTPVTFPSTSPSPAHKRFAFDDADNSTIRICVATAKPVLDPGEDVYDLEEINRFTGDEARGILDALADAVRREKKMEAKMEELAARVLRVDASELKATEF